MDHDELLTCPTCCITFTTLQELRHHFQICKTSQNFKCNICGDVYMQRMHLQNHLVCHAVERPCACKICGILFIHRHDLKKHLLTHARPVINHTKSNGSNQPSAIQDNNQNTVPVKRGRGRPPLVRDAMGNIISPPKIRVDKKIIVNNKNIKVSSPQKNSKSSDSTKPHMCIKCHKSFAREKALINHLKLHKAILNRYFTCRQCEQKFASPMLLQNHLVDCNGKKSNSRANSVEKKVNVKPAVRQIRNRAKHQCLKCDKSFSTRDLLRRHAYKHRRKNVSCPSCKEKFEFKKTLNEHILQKHKVEKVEKVETNKKTPVEVSEDSNDVNNDVPKSSHITDQSVNNYSLRVSRNKTTNLSSPIRSSPRNKIVQEEEQSSYACSLCSKTFNSKVVLTEHIRWLHTANLSPDNKGLYKCTICKKGMKSKSDLNTHFLTHSAESSPVDESKKNSVSRKIYREVEEDEDEDEYDSLVKNNVRNRSSGKNGVIGSKKLNEKHGENNTETVSTKRARSPKVKQNNSAKHILEKEATQHIISTKNKKLKALPKQSTKRNVSENNDMLKKVNGKTKTQTASLPTEGQATEKDVNEIVECDLCGQSFKTQKELVQHINVHI